MNIKPRIKVELKPKTHKGKNKLKEAGTSTWRVVRVSKRVICLDNRPGIYIEPDSPSAFNKRRWVEADFGPDFEAVR